MIVDAVPPVHSKVISFWNAFRIFFSATKRILDCVKHFLLLLCAHWTSGTEFCYTNSTFQIGITFFPCSDVSIRIHSILSTTIFSFPWRYFSFFSHSMCINSTNLTRPMHKVMNKNLHGTSIFFYCVFLFCTLLWFKSEIGSLVSSGFFAPRFTL